MASPNSSSDFMSGLKAGLQTGCLAIFINLVFLGLLGGGGYIAYTNYQLRTNGASTTGIVVRLEESSGDGGTTYSPVFQYQVNGQTYEFESQNASSPPTHRVGDRDTIFYDPTNPSKAQIDSLFDMWLAPGALLCVGGLGFLITNLVLVIWIVRRRR